MDNIDLLIIEEFPPEQRILPDSSFTAGISLAHDTKLFLKTIGCPILDELGVRFDMVREPPKTLTECGLVSELKDEYGDFICLGVENDCALCINDADGGSIWCVDLLGRNLGAGKEPAHFINTGIKLFAAFLALYMRYSRTFDDNSYQNKYPDSPFAVQDVRTLEQKMLELDEIALTRQNNWWSFILDEIKMGLM